MSGLVRVKLVVLIGFATVFGYIAAGRGTSAQQGEIETAGEKFKSIQVLKDMPANQMGKVMNMISASLGVNCSFCHASNDGGYEKEGFEHKDIARDMMRMVFELNKTHFGGKPEINCNTCHQGRPHPSEGVPLGSTMPSTRRTLNATQGPSPQSIIAKYETAVEVGSARKKIESMKIRSIRVEPDGKTIEPEAIYIKNGRYAADLLYGSYLVREVFDGTAAAKFGGTSRIPLKPDEAEQIKREIDIFFPSRLRSAYSGLKYGGDDSIEGREVHLVIGTTANDSRERLFFEKATGLLIRRTASTPTILGDFVFRVDYADYRMFGVVRLPTTMRYAVPHMGWTRKLIEVKVNAPVEDAVFGQPDKRE